MHPAKPSIAAACAALLMACTPTDTAPVARAAPDPAQQTRAQFIAAGAERFHWPDFIGDERVSIAFPNGGRLVYLADGGKVFTAPNGQTTERRWQRRGDGVFCEELVGDGRLVCGDAGVGANYRIGDDFRVFDFETGAPVWTMTREGPSSFVARRI